MRGLIIIAVALAAGCSTLETATPTLSPSQLAELRKRAKSPVELGLRGAPELVASGPVTVPLCRVDYDLPGQPGSRYRVPVVVGSVGGEDVRLMLDSGSTHAVCGYSLARALKLPTVAGAGPVGTRGLGGTVEHCVGVTPSLRIGSLEVRRLVTMIGPDVAALRVKREWFGTTAMMLTGLNTFRGLASVTLDYPRGRVRFAPAGDYQPERAAKFATWVPLRWSNDLPCVEIAVDGKGPLPCFVDTGGDYGLMVLRSRAEKLGYWRPGQGSVTPGRGVAGAGLTTAYTVREAKLGGATLRQVPGRTQVVGPEPVGAELMVGNVVLRAYRVTFDFKNQRLWLEQ